MPNCQLDAMLIQHFPSCHVFRDVHARYLVTILRFLSCHKCIQFSYAWGVPCKFVRDLVWVTSRLPPPPPVVAPSAPAHAPAPRVPLSDGERLTSDLVAPSRSHQLVITGVSETRTHQPVLEQSCLCKKGFFFYLFKCFQIRFVM